MNSFSHIDVEGAREKLDADQAIFVDIRDGESRRDGHIAGSVHLTEETVEGFLSATDTACPDGYRCARLTDDPDLFYLPKQCVARDYECR